MILNEGKSSYRIKGRKRTNSLLKDKEIKQMIFTEIYNRTIKLWDNEIIFSDGVISNSDNSCFYSDKMSELHCDIENAVGYDNPYDSFMAWTMYHSISQKS